MTSRSNLIAAIVFLISVTFSSLTSTALGGSPIVHIAEAHIKAIGGTEAIKAIKSIHRLATVGGASAYGPINGKAEEIADLEKKRGYASMDIVGYSNKTGFVGNRGWKWDSIAGDTPMPTAESELSKHSLGPSVLASMYEAHGDAAFDIGGQQNFNGAACTVITIVSSPMKIYVDKETNLLRGYTAPDLIVKMSDYKPIDGVQFPRKRSIIIESQNLTLDYAYTKSESNIKIDDSKFASRTGNTKTKPPAAPEYTPEQVIGFLDKDSDGKISKAESSTEIKIRQHAARSVVDPKQCHKRHSRRSGIG